MAIDWAAMGMGLLIGLGASAVFFAGLGLGMRLALRRAQPVGLLVLSAVVRIAALLGVGWAVATFAGPFALAGFAVAFLVMRTLATTLVRSGDAP